MMQPIVDQAPSTEATTTSVVTNQPNQDILGGLLTFASRVGGLASSTRVSWVGLTNLSSRIFFTILTFLFHFLFHPLYPTSLPSFPCHALTSNDKTIEHDDIGTLMA